LLIKIARKYHSAISSGLWSPIVDFVFTWTSLEARFVNATFDFKILAGAAAFDS
jgi:hypothetical protein